MQALLLNLPVELPLVIVDLIIEYKNQVEYAERVWKMYSLNFWQQSKDKSFDQNAYFVSVFRNIYYSDCFDEEKMEKAVIEYGNNDLWTEEQFGKIKQHLWEQGTEAKFEGKNFWILLKFSPK